MAFLTDAIITSALGGATDGAAAYAALTRGDSGTKAFLIAAADEEVVSAARKGGYSSVTATGPVPASGEAFTKLQMIAFREWFIMANLYVRQITVGVIGAASAQLYASVDEGRTDLPGLTRDALGGSSGADIVNGSDLTTDTPTAPLFPIADTGPGFC